MLNHPTDDEAQKLMQEILRMSNGLLLEIGWQIEESLPKRKDAPQNHAPPRKCCHLAGEIRRIVAFNNQP